MFELGAIEPTDSVEHVLEIRNVGDADLNVERSGSSPGTGESERALRYV